MSDSYKPGGGNKPQPYIPAGNGAKSGEYTDKPIPQTPKAAGIKHCFIKNAQGKSNFLNSTCVGRVVWCITYEQGERIPTKSLPFSAAKRIIDGYVVSERFFDKDGFAYLDIDYTCHGNPKTHPVVPHMHHWFKNSFGTLCRNTKWEYFK